MNTHIKIQNHFSHALFKIQLNVDFSKFSAIPYSLQRAIAFFGLVLIAPVLLLAMLLLKLESPGAVIFKQVRIGLNGRRFTLYKLRSMYTKQDPRYKEPTSSDREGVCKKSFCDPRITRIGKFFANTQLMNFPNYSTL